MDFKRFLPPFGRRSAPFVSSSPQVEQGAAHHFDVLQETIFRPQYDAVALQYDRAARGVLGLVFEGAQTINPARSDEPGKHELAAWRIDGDITDGRFDDVSRIRVLATPAATHESGIVPADLLLSAKIAVDGASQAVKKMYPDGMYVHRIGYRHMPLRAYPQGEIVPSRLHRFSNRLTDVTGGEYWQNYTATMQEATSEQLFPSFPSYDTVTRQAYADFCVQKTTELPLLKVIAQEIDSAATQNSEGVNVADNPRLYTELSTTAGIDARQRIKAMASGLYGRTPGEPLSADLVYALRHPHAGIHAQMALADRNVYRTQIAGRRYTSDLRQQMAVIARHADGARIELFAAMQSGHEVYGEALHTALQVVTDVSAEAQSMHDHLAFPQTFAPTLPHWSVRVS